MLRAATTSSYIWSMWRRPLGPSMPGFASAADLPTGIVDYLRQVLFYLQAGNSSAQMR